MLVLMLMARDALPEKDLTIAVSIVATCCRQRLSQGRARQQASVWAASIQGVALGESPQGCRYSVV